MDKILTVKLRKGNWFMKGRVEILSVLCIGFLFVMLSLPKVVYACCEGNPPGNAACYECRS